MTDILDWIERDYQDLDQDVKERLSELLTDVRQHGHLGRHPVVKPPPLPKIANYIETFPTAPPAFTDFETFPGPWGMLGNDRLGDCTWAGAVHLEMYNAWLSQVQASFPNDQQVGDAYLAYNNGQDTGDNEFQLLQYWQSTGLFGSKIVGFAPVDYANHTEVNATIPAFGGLYIGVNLPSVAQQQFDSNKPWDLTNSDLDNQIEGGHCVILVGFDSAFLYCITWGKVQPLTWNWLQRYCEESWAIITQELDTNKVGVNVSQLQQDIQQLSQQNPTPQM